MIRPEQQQCQRKAVNLPLPLLHPLPKGVIKSPKRDSSEVSSRKAGGDKSIKLFDPKERMEVVGDDHEQCWGCITTPADDADLLGTVHWDISILK